MIWLPSCEPATPFFVYLRPPQRPNALRRTWSREAGQRLAKTHLRGRWALSAVPRQHELRQDRDHDDHRGDGEDSGGGYCDDHAPPIMSPLSPSQTDDTSATAAQRCWRRARQCLSEARASSRYRIARFDGLIRTT